MGFLIKLNNWMRDNQRAYFEAFPTPNSKERNLWRSTIRFINNAYEGDALGGERGHSDVEKTALERLELLSNNLSR